MNTSQETRSTGTGTTGRYPVSNVVYDTATLLSERCKGIEALKQYRQDAQQGGHQAFVQLIDKMLQQDQQCCQELEQILHRNTKPQGQ